MVYETIAITITTAITPAIIFFFTVRPFQMPITLFFTMSIMLTSLVSFLDITTFLFYWLYLNIYVIFKVSAVF